jgi:hypothetical protein
MEGPEWTCRYCLGDFLRLVDSLLLAYGIEPNASDDRHQSLIDVVVRKALWKLLNKEPAPVAKSLETVSDCRGFEYPSQSLIKH